MSESHSHGFGLLRGGRTCFRMVADRPSIAQAVAVFALPQPGPDMGWQAAVRATVVSAFLALYRAVTGRYREMCPRQAGVCAGSDKNHGQAGAGHVRPHTPIAP